MNTAGFYPELSEHPRQLLFYYHLSRVVMAVVALFILIFFPPDRFPVLGAGIIVVWLGLGIVGTSKEMLRKPTSPTWIHLNMVADIAVLGLGGIFQLPSFMPFVALHVIVAFVALMFRPIIAVLYAAIGTIVVFSSLGQWQRFFAGASDDLVQPLVTVTGIFAAAMAYGWVKQSARLGASRLSQTRLRLSDLRQINRATIEKLDVGIAVLDNTLAIRQINDSARGMIGSLIRDGKIAGKLANKLIDAVNSAKTATLTTNVGHGILEVQAIPLHESLLIRVENKTEVALKLREARLAASGRLASSIAHEIRNPLNAINHAAQLLSLDADKDSPSGKVLQQIRQRAKHIDQIVESVLQRSRTGEDESAVIDLTQWLQGFAESFEVTKKRVVKFRIKGNGVSVTFDPMQLEQILMNLCKSMIDRSNSVNPEIELELSTRVDEAGNPHLEVVEHGRPLDARAMEKSFETFQGDESDADLYLVREICTINGAMVEYFHESLRGGFRVSFLAQDNQSVQA